LNEGECRLNPHGNEQHYFPAKPENQEEEKTSLFPIGNTFQFAPVLARVSAFCSLSEYSPLLSQFE